jgi:hypothetical protein
MDNVLGIESPKTQAVVPPPATPTQDQAQERAVANDRTRFRRGAAATRLAGALGGSGNTAAYRVMGGSS